MSDAELRGIFGVRHKHVSRGLAQRLQALEINEEYLGAAELTRRGKKLRDLAKVWTFI